MPTAQRWTGASWVDLETAKRWTGSSWVDLAFGRRWTGSEWVDVLRDPPTTDIWNAVETLSWRDTYDWRTDNDYVYQGEYQSYGNHRGCIFYGSNLTSIRSTLDGRNIDGAWVNLIRRNAGGSSAAQPVYAWLHVLENAPSSSGDPKPAFYGGPEYLGDLGWGDAKWLAIPTSWVEGIRDGTYDGIGFYQADTSPYVIMRGRSESQAMGSLQVSHS